MGKSAYESTDLNKQDDLIDDIFNDLNSTKLRRNMHCIPSGCIFLTPKSENCWQGVG